MTPAAARVRRRLAEIFTSEGSFMADLDHPLYFNGVDGDTGEYALPSTSLARFAARTRGKELPHGEPRAPEWGIDPEDLAAAGWGVVFAAGVDPAVREALRPLIELRRRQATAVDERYFRELTALHNEGKRSFLLRHQSAPGPIHPERLPYYLLLVGDPEPLSYELQYGLDVQHAVGRLCFDTAEEYAAYAASVVAAETGEARPGPARHGATLFGVRHEGDPATEVSVTQLVEPLAAKLRHLFPGRRIATLTGAAATKERLGRLLGGDDTPALLFTAGHAVLFRPGHPRQRPEQGGLLCAEWPGPRGWRGPIPEEHLFAGRDLAAGADVRGMVTFHFACFSAGTPRDDAFAPAGERRTVAPAPFIARLPQRLLAHSRGSALAVVGHVDRAWPQSFQWDTSGSQISVFVSAVGKILAGVRLGHALEELGQRYTEFAAELHDLARVRAEGGGKDDDAVQAQLWTACYDARGYVLLGDPAVRLAPEEEP